MVTPVARGTPHAQTADLSAKAVKAGASGETATASPKTKTVRPPELAGKPDQGHKKKKPGPADVEPAYFKFTRQFVVPVVLNGEPKAMMIMDVVVEMAPGADEGLYSREPKLRDAVLRALLAQSGNGELPLMLSNPELLEATRGAILHNIQEVIGDEALAVLLMDIAYQPF